MYSQLLEAIFFAAQRHSTQRRKGPGGQPYVNHLIEAATLLASVGGVTDPEVLIAAVLHDVLEDTPTTRDEVLGLFGERVLQLVDSLTDDKRLPRAARRQAVLDHLPHAEPATKVVKLADLCSNVMTLPSDWPPEHAREFLLWARSAAELCAGANPALEQLFRERWAITSQAWGLPAETGAVESGAAEPEAAEPEVAEPEVAEPEVAEPEVAEPEVAGHEVAGHEAAAESER